MAELILRPMTEPEIAAWYDSDFAEAFPENERKPLADILDLVSRGRYRLLGLFDGARMAGYAALWRREDIPLAFSPMVTPANIVALAPIQAFFLMTMGLVSKECLVSGSSGWYSVAKTT